MPNPIRIACLLVLALLPAAPRAADAIPSPPPASAALAPADGILGRWKPPEGDVVVAISKTPPGYGGLIVESAEKPSLVGTQMFRGLAFDAARGEWTGEVFAVKKGEFVPAVIRLDGGGFTLTAGKGLFSKKLAWKRVGP